MNLQAAKIDSIHIRHYDLPEGVNIHFTDELGGVLTNFTIADSGEIDYLYISELRELGMNVNYNNVIPVEIVSFNGRIIDGNNVELNWSTASETNNSGFQIEIHRNVR